MTDTVSGYNEEEVALTDNKQTVAAYSSENESGFFNESSRVQILEQEQEQLSGSLMALTSHFARVQFRLKQVVSAPNEEKESLLQELEEFAFRGCPNLNNPNVLVSEFTNEQIIAEQNTKQRDLIEQLKTQLQDLESYTKDSGTSSTKCEMNELNQQSKDLNKLNNQELKLAVENAINKVQNPEEIKEQVVDQLQTQIADLQRFISFLQGEAATPGPFAQYNHSCTCDKPSTPILNQPTFSANAKSSCNHNEKTPGKNEASSVDLLKRMLSVMQIFAISQLGCGTQQFEKNSLKKQSANHWGDLRANLEVSISKVLKLYLNTVALLHKNKLKFNSSQTSDSDEEHLNEPPNELIRAVRKDFACSLRDLMQHGLVEINRGTSMVPFGCFVVRSKEVQNHLHIWELILKYYEIKHGKEYTQSATNKLSQSFNLNVVSGKSITIKQSLLNAIDTVLKAHNYDTKNKDSCFKAFVCLALNEKKLVLYLKQLLKTTIIIENYYQTWSYVKSTGFDDALKSLDQLKILNSNFPVEKSTRRKSNNKEI